MNFGEGSIIINNLRYWGKFDISSQRGVNIIFFGFWLGVIGLACRLFFRYKKIGIKFVEDVEGQKQLVISVWIDMNAALFKKELENLIEEFREEVRLK